MIPRFRPRLLHNVMTRTMHYQALVIGSGQGGTPLAQAFAAAGQKTALVESTHIGGCCVNEGCTPTKTMIASGRVAFLARRAQDYGVNISGEISVDQSKVRQRKRDIVDSFRSGSEKRIQSSGVDLLRGTARFENPTTVIVDQNGKETKATADKIFIDTGESPAHPFIAGLEQTFNEGVILDSTSIQEIDIVPEHLLVVGGGYIGIEFGQLFRRLGAEVSVFQRGSQLFPREDEDIAEAVKGILEEDGVKIHLGASVQSITPANGGAAITYKDAEGTHSVNGSHILLAAGRVPNTPSLNLSAAGVEVDAKGYVKVNEKLQTSQSHIWALGDVKGPPAFTHVSYDDYRILKANLLDNSSLSTKDRDLKTPYVAYMDPQLAHIGLHEHEARQRYPGKRVQTATMPMNYVARALETDETRGMMKAVVDADSELILGFTCLGLEGGEIMSVVQVAMLGGTKWTVLRDAVFAHPTLAESLNNLWGSLK